MNNQLYNNNDNNEELYADLFAYRFALLDMYDNNEREIIRKLKYKLIQWNYNTNDLNLILIDFYNFYLINITREEIEDTRIISYNTYSFFNFNNNDVNENNSNIEISNTEINNTLLFDSINNFILRLREIREQEEQIQEDVKITVDEDTINKLDVIELTEDIDTDCSICIEGLVKGNEVIKLNCNHYFHKDCIRSHLLNYDYKCPLCRSDVGNHKYS